MYIKIIKISIIIIFLILILIFFIPNKDSFKNLEKFITIDNYNIKIEKLNNAINNWDKNKDKIPKIIHQIWMDNKNELNINPYMPEKYSVFSNGWGDNNKDYTQIIWNGYEMDKFIRENYNNYYELYKKFPRWIYRCDMFRYIILNKYGGVYLDMDFVCIKSLPIWQHKVILFSDCKPDIVFCGVNNCILVSEPNNIFWINVLNEIDKRFKENPDRDLVEITGPNLLNDIQKTNDIYIEKNPCYFFNHHYNDRDKNKKPEVNNCSIGYHLWDFTWKNDNIDTKYNNSISEINTNDYDIIMIGGGLYGLLFANLISKNKKVLILEAGGIELKKHIASLDQSFVKTNYDEGIWEMSHNKLFLEKKQTPDPYALGGKSPYWGGWATIPSINDISDQNKDFIDNFIKYYNKCKKVLNLNIIKKVNWIDEKFKKYNQEAYLSIIDNVPFCQITETLTNKNIKVITNCKTINLIYKDNNIKGIFTTNGYLDCQNNNVILSSGTYNNINILLNSNTTHLINKNVGRNFIDHVFSRIKIRIKKNNNIKKEKFFLKPFQFCYVQCYFDNNDYEEYLYMTIDGFVSVTENYDKRFFTKGLQNKNNDGSYIVNLQYILNDTDLLRWDMVDNFIDDFINSIPEVEYYLNDTYQKIIFKDIETQKEIWNKRRQPLLSSYHDSGGLSYGKVVDINSKVKNINNLFIVGPSVLPTINGCSPVILTTCMLLNLHDHLVNKIKNKNYRLLTVDINKDNEWIMDGNNKFEWIDDSLNLYYSKSTIEKYNNYDWSIYWLNKELPKSYKITLQVKNLTFENNSGIFLNFERPIIIKNFKDLVENSIEVQLLNTNDPYEEKTGKMYGRISEYYKAPPVNNSYNIEISLVEDLLMVFFDNKLVSYAPYTIKNTLSKFFGLQIHEGGDNKITFSNIKITNLDI